MDQFQNLPPEYAAQLQALQRKKQFAELLSQRAFAPQQTEMVSGRAVKRSPLSQIAQALTGVVSQSGAANADSEMARVMQGYQQKADSELAAAQNLPEMEAIKRLRVSRDPRAQKLAETMYKALQDRAMKKGDILKGEDTNAAIQAVDGTLSQDYKLPSLGPVTFGQEGPNRYALVPQKNGGREFKWAPMQQQTTIDVAGERGVVKAIGAKVPDVLESARNTAMQAQDGLNQSQLLIRLARDPETITGFGAGPVAGIAALAAKMGFTGPDAVAKTQGLLSAIAGQTLEASKDLKGAITEKEKPFLEEAKAGRLSYTPEALTHLAALATAVNHNKLIAAREQWQGAASVQGAENGVKMWPFPPIEHTLPEGIQFGEGPQGRIKYDGSYLFKPKTVAPAPASSSGEKVYTLEEFKKLYPGMGVK